jgi:hypothetical protein
MVCVETVDAQHPPCGRYAHRANGVFSAPRGPENAGPGVPDTRNPTAPARVGAERACHGQASADGFRADQTRQGRGEGLFLPDGGTEDGGTENVPTAWAAEGKRGLSFQRPPARAGRGHRPGHAERCPQASRGPKPPASARPAHGGRFTPAGPGAGLCCTCANGPHGAVVASRAGKRGAFPDPPGLAAPFPGSGRYSRPMGGRGAFQHPVGDRAGSGRRGQISSRTRWVHVHLRKRGSGRDIARPATRPSGLTRSTPLSRPPGTQ